MFSPLVSALHQSRNTEVPALKSMKADVQMKLEGENQHLFMGLANIYYRIFNDKQQPIDLRNIFPFVQIKTESAICSKQIKSSQTSFRCYDCLFYEGSLICQQCFNQGEHKSHRYIKVKQSGTCDCGNISFLKESGFCKQHIKNMESARIQIKTQKVVMYNFYIKQLFIWVFRIYSQVEQQQGIIFLYHILKYLTEINTSSPHYNQLTTQVFFSHQIPIISQIFQIVLTKSHFAKKLQVAMFDLILSIIPFFDFKVALLPLLIKVFNQKQHFQTSQFQRFMVILMSQSRVIEQSMKRATQTLDPSGRPYNALKYYELLLILPKLPSKAAQLFILPLIAQKTIHSPLLSKVQLAQLHPQLFLQTITSNIVEQFMYYRTVFAIIGIVNNKQIQIKMINNYFKLITNTTYKHNKIVLIPHRIFVMLIFKYFDFDLSLISGRQLMEVLGLGQEQMLYLMLNLFGKFIGCLQEFSLNLSRNTYFYNYVDLYLQDNSQIVMVDYLAIKIIIHIFHTLQQSQRLVEFLIKNSLQGFKLMQNSEMNKKIDFLQMTNKIIEVYIQIAYSPQNQTITKILLQNKNIEDQATEFLVGVMKSCGKMSQQNLQSIMNRFFLGECSQKWISNTMRLNASTLTYELNSKQDYDHIEPIKFDLMMSLTNTSFNSQMQSENNKNRFVVFNEQQKMIADVLLNKRMIEVLFMKQMELVLDIQITQLFKEIPHIVRITNILKQLLPSLFQFDQLYGKCLQESQRLLLICQQKNNQSLVKQSKSLQQELQRLIRGQQGQQKYKVLQEVQGRRKMAKLKKERLLKDLKYKQNQQKYLQQGKPSNREKQNFQECLICKQRVAKTSLCYLSKVVPNVLLYNQQYPVSKMVIFYSCFHMVHFNCFRQQIHGKVQLPCPLCQSASNIVLPHQQIIFSQELLQVNIHISSTIDALLNYSSSRVQSAFSLAYILYLFLYETKQPSQKEYYLYRSIYTLLIHQIKLKGTMEPVIPPEIQQRPSPLSLVCQIKSFIMACLKEYFKFKQSFETITRTVNTNLRRILNMDQLQKVINILTKIIIPQHNYQIHQKQMIAEGALSQYQFPFPTLPNTLPQLFQLRQYNKCKKKAHHTTTLCIICGSVCCIDCEEVKSHGGKKHFNETLYFNLQTGGIFYYHTLTDITIRSLYENKIGQVWNPQLEVSTFQLNHHLYHQMCQTLKRGHLFYYLTHKFQGLKSQTIPDII